MGYRENTFYFQMNYTQQRILIFVDFILKEYVCMCVFFIRMKNFASYFLLRIYTHTHTHSKFYKDK
jgi:hypothetical protein